MVAMELDINNNNTMFLFQLFRIFSVPAGFPLKFGYFTFNVFNSPHILVLEGKIIPLKINVLVLTTLLMIY